MVLTIRDLLYRQGYTIQGARNQLRDRGRGDAATAAVVAPAREPAATPDFPAPPPEVDDRSREILRAVKRELLELRKRLD